ncbi:MAG: hypothetical protein M1840_009095 [Geoglossum simile]|nr:MAG: hypothetical protein M1840_009095 [Geoglossum simile]
MKRCCGSSNAHSKPSDRRGTSRDSSDDGTKVETNSFTHYQSVGSQSSAGVPQSVKMHVQNLFQFRCWLCNQGQIGEVAHVYPRADEDMFLERRAAGLISAPTIDSAENLLLLCPNCHLAFGVAFPGWIMLPTNLSDMIAREEAFQAFRQCEHEAGRPCVRIANPSEVRTYQRFVVRRSCFKWNIAVFSEVPVKEWEGDPVCAILRSAGFLAVPHNNPLLLAVTPLYLRLLELYQKPIPPVAVLCGEDGSSGNGNHDGKDGDTHSASEDELQRDDMNMIFRPLTSTLSHSKTDHSQPHCTQANTKSSDTYKHSAPLRLPILTKRSARQRTKRQRLDKKLSHCEPDRLRDDIMFGPDWTSEELGSLWRFCGTPIGEE